MSEDSQVTKLLAKRFSQPGERGRIVFWRDDKKQYADDVATLVGEHATDEVLREVELITPEIGDENDGRYIPFTVRYCMFHEQPNQKFLVYLTEPAPADQDNWLLDLELAYGPTFTMDKLAVTLTETLPEASADTRNEWLEVMKRVPKFFDSEERAKRFAKRLNAHDDATDFQAKMIATLLQLKDDRHSMQDIWAELLTQYSQGDDSGITVIERMGLRTSCYGCSSSHGMDSPMAGTPFPLMRILFATGTTGIRTSTCARYCRIFPRTPWRNCTCPLESPT